MQLAAFDGAFPKTRFRRKNLAKPIKSPSCPNFRSHSNLGWLGKNAISSIRRRILENLSTGAKISRKLLTPADL